MPVARIESLAYGPHGVARIDGKVHFVRGAAPGDEVEIAVREDRGSFAYADVVRVIRRGEARREPPCPYLPRCGGCPWQHVADDQQAAAKERVVRELLARVGGVADPRVLPILRPSPAFGYRRRLSLRIADGRIGFLAAASHDLVPIDRCLLAAPELEGSIPLAQAWIDALRTPLNRIEIAATGEGDRIALVAQAEGAFATADAAATEAFLAREPRVAGATLRGRGWRRAFGDDLVRVPLVDGDEMRLRAGDFSQVGDDANETLIRTVLDLVGPLARQTVADLYAGAGNLSIPLARRAGRVLAVERAASGAAAARANAERLGLANLEAIAGDVPQVLDQWGDEHVLLEAVVLDPPRSGAVEAMPRIAALGPQRIVYVSCDPATLARDVKRLCGSGQYRLDRAQPIDFFPQTHHVETVALILRA
ncbi:MAG TPA: 23S rRNA (uracil(1939)-C(5))-methyltransferase RlmD [Candidatus Binatia bacterium]|nr:23S rRNA (uracil(1939)-C(5))-methyltransferase RlmD [Candidatus Binatia bacterium]